MSEALLVIGGFTTGKRVLEPVAATAVMLGLANDAEVITFRKAMKYPDRVHRFLREGIVLTHSAGILAVEGWMNPSRIIASNGPEPRSRLQLIGAASRKTAQHAKSVITGPERAAYAKVMSSNAAELTMHPNANLKHLGNIAEFSTFEQLTRFRQAGILSSAIVTDGDVFFPYDASVAPIGVRVDTHPGSHDELLINPAPLLNRLI